MAEVVIVGCGEVGLAYTEAMVGLPLSPRVQVLDPAPSPAAVDFVEGVGLASHRAAGPWLLTADLVLLAIPGGALAAALESVLPHLQAAAAVADMSTASAESKQAAAERCRELGIGYVDIAITGSVALGKARTPLLYAGPRIPFLMSALEQIGAPLTVLEGAQPGDAVRVKLFRSVIMKGLEGLAVECLPAARAAGVLDQLWASLSDVDRTGFVPLLQAMVRTHPRHATRREHEVAEAADQLEQSGFPSSMTRATMQRFAATNLAVADSRPVGETADTIIDWLCGLHDPGAH